MRDKLLAIGWDVGGWMGNNHGFSIIQWDYDKKEYKWLGKSIELGIPAASNFALEYIIEQVTDKEEFDLDAYNMVIAVDAPLRLPKEFKAFLENRTKIFKKPEKEIYNKLAYRETDVHIYERLGKKPLSAVFDRLGTNSTVAMVHLEKWKRDYGFSIKPIEDKENNRDIIEVYPALLKASKYSAAEEPFKTMIADRAAEGTDAYDSALCAIMALAYAADIDSLPELLGPEKINEAIKEEGWIYYFSNN